MVAKMIGEELKFDIELNVPVQEIIPRKYSIDTFYSCGTNKSLNRRAVKVAIPPALHQIFIFTPGLNGEYRRFLQRSPMGSKFKVLAVYDKAFWREDGYCGLAHRNSRFFRRNI